MRTIILLFALLTSITGFSQTYNIGDRVNDASNTPYGIVCQTDPEVVVASITESPTRLNWDNANLYCNSLVFAEYDDWYLPTLQQMQNIRTLRLGGNGDCLSLYKSKDGAMYWTSNQKNWYSSYFVFLYKTTEGAVGNTMKANIIPVRKLILNK